MRKLIFVLLLFSGMAFAQTAYPTGSTVTSFSLVTTTGGGTSYAFSTPCGTFTWTVTFKTAAPGAQTTNLEGSLDNTNWYTLDSSTSLTYVSDTSSGEMRHVVNKRVKFIRCNLATYTAGSNAGVSCNLVAMP